MAPFRCVTNNPRWQASDMQGFEFIEGNALRVFETARDLVHQGWSFLGHPLYGNFNPAKMPYRTLLLQGPAEEGKSNTVDMESFSMIEKAMESIRAAKEGSGPAQNPQEMLGDYAYVDYELMKDTIGRYMKRTI